MNITSPGPGPNFPSTMPLPRVLIPLLLLSFCSVFLVQAWSQNQKVENLPAAFYERAGLEKMPRIDYAAMPVVDVREMGAKGDGKTDDSAAFNKAVAALAGKGGGVVFVPEGNYYFAEAPAPYRRGWAPKMPDGGRLKNIHFVGAGPKSVILFKHTVAYKFPSAYYGWSLSDAQDCSVRDLRFSCEPLFDQRWFPGTGIYPLAFNGSENVQVLRVLVDQGEIGICFWRPSLDTWIVGCAVRNTAADGIHFENGSRVTVAYNWVENSGDDGIATLGTRAPQTVPVKFEDNRFLYNTVVGVSWGRGLLIGGTRMDVIGNWIEGPVFYGILLSSAPDGGGETLPVSDVHISRNTLLRCAIANRNDTALPGSRLSGAIHPDHKIDTLEIDHNAIIEARGDGVNLPVFTSHSLLIHDNAFVNNRAAGVGVRLPKTDAQIDYLQVADNLFAGNREGAVAVTGPFPIESSPSDLKTVKQAESVPASSPFVAVGEAPDETDWHLPEGPVETTGLPTFNVRDFGAKGDGKNDDTAAFLQAVAEAPASGAVVKIPAGNYLLAPPEEKKHSPDTAVPHTFQIAGKAHLHLVGEGEGTVLTIQDPATNGVRFLGCTDCSLESLKIVSADPVGYRNNRCLVEAAASEGIRLLRLGLEGSGGPGIMINASRAVEVGNVSVSRPGMEGIVAAASRQVSIHDCQVSGNRDHGIKVTWMGSLSRPVQFVRIERNKIDGSEQGAGIALLAGDHVEVLDNRIHGGRLGGIAIYEKARLFSHQHLLVARNHIEQSPEGSPTYVEGAISIWNLVYAKETPPRIDLTLEGNRFGEGVTTPIWVALNSSSLHSLTLKDNALDANPGTPVAPTFDDPGKVGEKIGEYHP